MSNLVVGEIRGKSAIRIPQTSNIECKKHLFFFQLQNLEMQNSMHIEEKILFVWKYSFCNLKLNGVIKLNL